MDKESFYRWQGKCGLNLCGYSAEALGRIRDVLSILKDEITLERWDRIKAEIPDDGVRPVFIGWLNNAGLTECSSPPDASWLTDTGAELLQFLRDMSVEGIEDFINEDCI